MRFPLSLIIAWLAFLLAPAAMVIGHQGTHELTWTGNHISTYAAHAPNAGWITASMLLSALALACIGISIIRNRELGKGYLGQIGSMVLGAAVSGLLLLTAFQETAPDEKALEALDLEALRQQMFHDSGLFLFFFGSILAALVVGLAILFGKRNGRERMVGGMIAATGPAAAAAMSHAWPHYIGILGNTAGIRQRAAFLCLWAGALLLLAFLTKKSRRRSSEDGSGGNQTDGV